MPTVEKEIAFARVRLGADKVFGAGFGARSGPAGQRAADRPSEKALQDGDPRGFAGWGAFWEDGRVSGLKSR